MQQRWKVSKGEGKGKKEAGKTGQVDAYGKVHHAGLGRLLDVLALRDLGVGVELVGWR